MLNSKKYRQQDRATYYIPPSEDELKKKKQKTKWSILAVLSLLVILTGVELFFQETGIETPIASNIAVLILVNVNVILLLILVLLVARNLVRLYIERRTKVIGSGFQTKLVLSYFVITLVPSTLLFLVASGLLTSSIDKWFNVQVEKSMMQSLEVADSFYKGSEENILVLSNMLSDLFAGKKMMNKENQKYLDNTIKKKIAEYGLSFVVVYDAGRNKIAGNFYPGTEGFWEQKEWDMMISEAVTGKPNSRNVSFKNQNFVVAASPVVDFIDKKVIGVTVASKFISKDMVSKINNITKAFGEYMQLRVLKVPIKVSYEITLLLITLVILFGAIWYGFYLAKGISVPIQELVEATHMVAGGNLDYKIQVRANDEIKMLVDAFNIMISNMKTSKQAIDKGNEELKNKNIELDRHIKYVETILESVAAGVVSIDRIGRVSTLNRSASEILGLDPEIIRSTSYRKVFDNRYLAPIKGIIKDMKELGVEHMEKQIQVTISGRAKILLVNMNVLRNEHQVYQGMVVVFDDLTELIKAQKVAAWQEVAQGIAHEIKNPLTPILLSTERLQKKFKEGADDFDSVFNTATNVITSEVEGLKRLVDSFSKFARMPEPNLRPENLHEIMEEVVNLYKDNRKGVKLSEFYGVKEAMINVDREQIKRVFINLLENSLDAVETSDGKIIFESKLDKEKRMVNVIISDNGSGISPNSRDKLFIPYFSTKKKGTGLGLAIVNRIVADHNGIIKVEDNIPKGTKFIIGLPTLTDWQKV